MEIRDKKDNIKMWTYHVLCFKNIMFLLEKWNLILHYGPNEILPFPMDFFFCKKNQLFMKMISCLNFCINSLLSSITQASWSHVYKCMLICLIIKSHPKTWLSRKIQIVHSVLVLILYIVYISAHVDLGSPNCVLFGKNEMTCYRI